MKFYRKIAYIALLISFCIPISVTYSSSALSDGDIITLPMTNATCANAAKVSSNAVSMSPFTPVTVDSIANITVCNGETVPSIYFSGTGTSYSWTCANTSIGISDSGTDSIPSFTAVNAGVKDTTVTITVTPKIKHTVIYVANSSSNNVSVINTEDESVFATIPVGTTPNAIVIKPDGSRAYVVNYGSKTVSVINTVTNSVIATIPVGGTPGGIVITPDGNYVYVTNSDSDAVCVISTATNTVTNTVSVGKYPTEIAISPNGSRVYVVNYVGNSVSVINTSTNAVISTISIGTWPKNLTISPDGARVYVSWSATGYGLPYDLYTIDKIDASTNKVVTKISYGNTSAGCFRFNSDGSILYVTSSQGVVSGYNSSDAVTGTVPFGVSSPCKTILNADNSLLYSSFTAKKVAAINTNTNTVAATISLGTSTSNVDIEMNPEGTRLFAACNNNVYVLNTSLSKILNTIPVGTSPSKMYFAKVVYPGISRTFTITVHPTVVPSVKITASSGTICAGDSVTFKATATNGGATPAYYWTINGISVGGNSDTFTADTLKNNDALECTMVGTANCASTGTVVSNKIIMKVNQPTHSTTNAAICQGQSYAFNGNNYAVSGTYVAHLTNRVGCDSTATLVLTVNQPSSSTTNATICQGESYTFNGNKYTVAGTYAAHLTNRVGCDSTATLVLTVNQPSSSTTKVSICKGESYSFNGNEYTLTGTYAAHLTNRVGCDSTATLVLTVNLPSSSTTKASICQGESYTFNGNKYTVAGTYAAHLTNRVGCDSTATLVLTVNQPSSSTTKASICQGGSYSFNGKSYTSTGTYAAKLINSVGCDSTATLELTVNQPSFATIKAAICKGSSYTFNGKTYSTTGTYTAKLINSVGCDSTATLELTVNQPTSATKKIAICKGDSYSIGSYTFTTAGTYTVHLTNVAGCDSTVTLKLTVNSPSSSVTKATICYGENYRFNGVGYTQSGTYKATLTNSVGCDSTATLLLTVNKPSSHTITASVCKGNSYTFEGKAYFNSGTYTAKHTNSVGCDSIVTLILNVKSPVSLVLNETICNGEVYVFGGKTYSKSGTYTKTYSLASGCDSVVTLNLTVSPEYSRSQNITLVDGEEYVINNHSYSQAGNYTDVLKSIAGCDSTVVTNITVITMPNTITPNGDGINDVFMAGWKVRIFNRNGILMYEGTGGWDGTKNGKPVENDTYFYELSVPDSKTKKRGFITVAR